MAGDAAGELTPEPGSLPETLRRCQRPSCAEWHLVPGAQRSAVGDLPERYGPWETGYKSLAGR